ncbi:MAG: phosphatase PAP2 family protein [Mucilaginibacter sp.]
MKIGIKDLLYSNRFFLIPYIIILAICLVIKLNFTKDEIYFAVNAHYSNFFDTLAPYVTDIGNGWTTVAICAILVLFDYRKAFLLATSYVMTGFIFAQSLKYFFDAPRPKLYFQNQLSRIHFVSGTDVLSTHSFPSGHTITAFSTAIVILYFLKNKSWGMVLLPVAICVGFSRMYLSQHFFEDVTMGSLVGVFVTIIWLYYIDNKQFLHSPKWNKGLLK